MDRGEPVVAALIQIVNVSKNADARTKAVFTLYRIGTSTAMKGVRQALKDTDVQVSVAAARSIGLAKDKPSYGELITYLDKGADPLKRQAATALGQVNDLRAVPALLDAAAKTDDRFIRHAIIHTLITLHDVSAVRARLSDTSARVREAVIIALDQMPDSPLSVKELTPFLTHKNRKLQQVALWAASHHPEWSADMISFLDKQLHDNKSFTADEKLLSDMLISFGAEPKMQQYIAAKLVNASRDRQLFLLNAMMRMNIKEFPAVWASRLSTLLEGSADERVKSKVIELIQLRGLASLQENLARIANSHTNPATLRMQAIMAANGDKKKLSKEQFDFLFEQLSQKGNVAGAQQAASVMEKYILTDRELDVLADKYLPQADPFILPKLVAAFQGEHSADIGRKLARTLEASSTLDGYSEERLRKVFEKYPAEVQPDVDKLIARLNTVHADRISYLKGIEAGVKDGVLDRGRILFFGKATCYTCHKIGTQGGQFGPDLTSIQRDRSTHDLLEAIVYPGASFVREYETYKISTANGVHTGIIKSSTPDEIVLETSLQSSIRIAKSDVKSMEQSDVSMMPQGLDKLLTPQEMADLMAFLLGQDQDPETDQRILRHTVN